MDTVRFHDALTPLLVPADEVRPHPDNAKNGDTDAIVRSMLRNGVYRPVMAQRSTGYVLAGNHTYAALLELGAEQVPVVWLDVDVDEARRIMLADNRTADLGRMDDALLAQLLQATAEVGGLDGTGYDDDDLAGLLALLDGDGPIYDGDDQDAADEQEKAAWPKINVAVPPDVWARWQAIVADDDVERIVNLLTTYEQAVKAG